MSSLLVSSFGLQPSACPYIKSHALLEFGAAVETQPFECGACHANSSNHRANLCAVWLRTRTCDCLIKVASRHAVP